MNGTPVDYTSSTHTVYVGSREVIVRNLVPKLSEEKHQEVKNSIEKSLYGIFYKYMT